MKIVLDILILIGANVMAVSITYHMVHRWIKPKYYQMPVDNIEKLLIVFMVLCCIGLAVKTIEKFTNC